MKQTLLIASAISIGLCISCGEKPHYRFLDEIFQEALSAYSDSTDTEHFITIMNEYADSLYSKIVNSPLNDVEQRVMAQKRAGDALSMCLDYPSDSSSLISGLIDKFDKVCMSWRAVSGDQDRPGYSYIKELYFVANKETDHESDEVMHFVVWTGADPLSLVTIPDGDDDAVVMALFCNNAPEEGENFIIFGDDDSALAPDFLTHTDGPRCYGFDGSGFFEQMMSHDYLFVLYTVGEEDFESVMVNLDRFHEIVDNNIQH